MLARAPPSWFYRKAGASVSESAGIKLLAIENLNLIFHLPLHSRSLKAVYSGLR
jgi:hypothetical protein